MNEREFAELAAGHALHALSDADEARYAEALRAHLEWERIARADAATASELAEATERVEPDEAIRASLLARIAQTPQASADSGPSGAAGGADQADSPSSAAGPAPAPRRRLRILFTLAASLVLLVGLGIGAVALSTQLMRPDSVVALEQIETAPDAQHASVALEGGGTATAYWSAELASAVLVTDGLAPLDEEETYQLWFVRGDTPVPAGLFTPSEAEAAALLAGDMHSGDVIAVTIEPAGGSPTGLPTSEPIIAIPTV